MVYKRVSSVLFFSIVWMLLVCPKAYSQSNSMRVARIFSDNMVLQQGIHAPVWGWADSGATVRISMSEKEYETVADDTGKWLVNTATCVRLSLEGAIFCALSGLVS